MATSDDKSDKATVGWIYQMNKEALISETDRLKLDSSGTVEELRQRLSAHYRSQKGDRLRASEEQNKQLQEEIDRLREKVASLQQPIPPHTEDIETNRGNLLDKVRKWGLSFDGQKDATSFLERSLELKECYNISDTNMFVALPELLRGNALLWYRNNVQQWGDWQAFLTAFRQFFLPANRRSLLENEIRNRTQKRQEPVKEYVTALQTLIRRHGGFSTAEELEQIYNNLWPHYKLYVRRLDFRTLPELIERSEEYEVLQRSLNEPQHTKITGENKRTWRDANNGKVENYDRNLCCWKCGKRGHNQRECRSQWRRFCSRCGTLNVLSKDCTCPLPENAPGTGIAAQQTGPHPPAAQ